MGQVVECLLCKCEALRSNPSPQKKKRKEKRNRIKNEPKETSEHRKTKKSSQAPVVHVWEADIRRIMVQDQPRQLVLE
jgi:hypothetical protein